MNNSELREKARRKRHRRVRKKISGSAERPRLAVFRSARHIYVQAIDDDNGITLAAASTKNLGEKLKGSSGNVKAAKLVGEDVAAKLKEKLIENVLFDRGGFLFHGRVKALAEGAREAGLNF